MAKEKRKFNKNLALMCIVPVLVLVVTMSIMGVTFAWFNDADETTIATIDLSVSKTFEMTFEIATNTLDDERYIYKGETAYDSNGLLVTDVHAREELGLEADTDSYNWYILDKAFVAPFNVKLDTGTYYTTENGIDYRHGFKVDFNCIIESVHIYNPENPAIEITLPTDNGTPDKTSDDITVEDIKMGFTWYINKGNQWYTPYGEITATTPTDKNTTIPSIDTNNWQVPISTKEFSAIDEMYTFNIVFAPEVLFWKQYGSTTDYMETAKDIYGADFLSDKWNAINRYSLLMYSGSTYSFTVLLTVENIVPLAPVAIQ